DDICRRKDSTCYDSKRQVMPIPDCQVRDPRMRRTRQLLQNALRSLLDVKKLDEIGVQDITDAATVNGARFYDHYTDKYALFSAMIEGDIHKLLEERKINFDGSCSSGLAATLLAICEYFGRQNSAECAQHRSFTPLMDNAITVAIRERVLNGLS